VHVETWNLTEQAYYSPNTKRMRFWLTAKRSSYIIFRLVHKKYEYVMLKHKAILCLSSHLHSQDNGRILNCEYEIWVNQSWYILAFYLLLIYSDDEMHWTAISWHYINYRGCIWMFEVWLKRRGIWTPPKHSNHIDIGLLRDQCCSHIMNYCVCIHYHKDGKGYDF
jgi:hypothetical protein